MKALLAAALLLAVSASAATTNNDDSCDIALQPAATLLLPHFEVDIHSRAATALITVQNLSPSPVIANVTLWTDWGYPALTFPIQLTGYDVEGINLYDVFANGTLPASACGGPSLSPLLSDLQSIFTIGKGTTGCTAQVGGVHYYVVGYATIDVVASCSGKNDFTNLLFDNVLTGDSQQLLSGPTAVYASSSPLVHLRAVPEGGAAGTVVATALPHTFYERYVPVPKSDRRQPLPSAFAARFILGGTGAFNTSVTIWREGLTTGTCSGAQAARSNAALLPTDVVRFDEHENATVIDCGQFCFPQGIPVTGRYLAGYSSLFPPVATSGDVGGWLYVNTGRQSWITTSMYAEPTYAAESTAAALGNGCSPPAKFGAPIGPMP